MLMNNFSNLKYKEINILFLLFSVSFIVRLAIVLIYGDTSLDHEWKHLVNNLIVHGQLVYESFDGFLLPNLWMPPLYPYYIYIFSFIGLEGQNYVFVVLLSQILLASISVIMFYKINKIFFSQKLSFYSSLLFSLFPLNVYACSQISSITLQTFLFLFFIYFFFRFSEEKSFLFAFALSFVTGLMFLLRTEFVAIFALSVVYLFIFFKIPIKKILFVILITVITASPYLIRNYLIFEKITLTQSYGYILWKGNHPYAMKNSLAEGSEEFDENLRKKKARIVDGFIVLDAIPRDKYYRFKFNQFFLDQTITNIEKDPLGNFIFFIKKVLTFLFIDIKSSEANYYNPLHYIPVLLLGIASLFGIGFSNKKSYKLNYLIIIFFAFVFIISTTSIIPRYKLIILPLQIIFTNVLIESIRKKNSLIPNKEKL